MKDITIEIIYNKVMEDVKKRDAVTRVEKTLAESAVKVSSAQKKIDDIEEKQKNLENVIDLIEASFPPDVNRKDYGIPTVRLYNENIDDWLKLEAERLDAEEVLLTEQLNLLQLEKNILREKISSK